MKIELWCDYFFSISVNYTIQYSTICSTFYPIYYTYIYPQLSLNLITNVFYEQDCRSNINYCFNEKEPNEKKLLSASQFAIQQRIYFYSTILFPFIHFFIILPFSISFCFKYCSCAPFCTIWILFLSLFLCCCCKHPHIIFFIIL